MKDDKISRTQLMALLWAGVMAPAAELLPALLLPGAGRGAWLAVVLSAPLVLAAGWLHTDYGSYGVLLILALSLWRKNRPAALALATAAVLLHCAWNSYWPEAAALTALLPIAAYSGARGRAGPKYAFYLYYPLHLLALCLLRLALGLG